jgi:hypothetical protein
MTSTVIAGSSQAMTRKTIQMSDSAGFPFFRHAGLDPGIHPLA